MSAKSCSTLGTLNQTFIILMNQANSEENIEMRVHSGHDEDDIMMTNMMNGPQYMEGDDSQSENSNSSKDDDNVSISSTGMVFQ